MYHIAAPDPYSKCNIQADAAGGALAMPCSSCYYKEARIQRSGGQVNIYYGGTLGNTPGDGHGHVKATGGLLGENIVYWRLPESEGGEVIVSNSWDVMYGNDLSDYLR